MKLSATFPPTHLSIGIGHEASNAGRASGSCARASGTDGLGCRGGCCQNFSVIQSEGRPNLYPGIPIHNG
jgi:hypothetical protein